MRGANGTTLVLNDIVGNIRDRTGLGGWLLKLFGFAGERPQIPAVVKRKIANKAALRDQLLEWSALGALTRILVSHGAPIEHEPASALRMLAASLA